MPIDRNQLQEAISRLGLQWRPAETSNSAHSDIQAQSRCGAVPPAGVTLADREERARAALSAGGPVAGGAPAAWDWRNAGGASYVTPIKDQGGCGSCVAFGTIASFEARTQIAAQDPYLGVNLSEAHLWFCYGPSHGAGACPGGGWWPDSSFPGLVPGIVPSSCFPYTDQNQSCNPCVDWKIQLTQASAWETLNNQAAMKAFIAQTGPMTACFTVYEDFYNYYSGGVYEYNAETSGSVVGGHCVSIVGYSDAGKYWIAKNSWGSGWGEEGFFQIGYGNCGIDSEMWGINGTLTSDVWHMPQTDWKWCKKCQSLSFAGNSSPGACSAGGSHDHTGSGNYALPQNITAGPSRQSNWRWCNKCQVLAFAGNSSQGPCAAGGVHNHGGSGDYVLVQNVSVPGAQSNWRWCNKCQVLAFAGNSSPGPCAAGGVHNHGGSGNYEIVFAAS